MVRKTSVDEKNPQKDDALVALLGARMLMVATELLLDAADDERANWSEYLMRAFIFLIDRGEEHAGINHPSVRELRDLCNEHLAGGVQ
jgi:hypothetical protein